MAKDVIEEAFVIVPYTTLLARADHDSLISARRDRAVPLPIVIGDQLLLFRVGFEDARSTSLLA